MVKADVRKDYYADLGLAPNAESEDIKKQFRKLALKFHPDRNPGKELDFIAKFQAIQAAHEILSDPQQRLKYDTERLRAGYGKQYAAAKANTSRKAPGGYTSTSATKPPFSARPQSYNGPSAGAQRYASYARAAPGQWGKQDDGQTRADAFRAFQGMKNNSPNTSGWSNLDPRTGRSGNVPRPGATPQSSRTKSAYEYFRSSPRSEETTGPTRSQTKKRNGFAPGNAGGDEPMAANTSAYSSVHREERQRPSSYFYGHPGPSPTARRADGASFQSPDLERSRSQYSGGRGERTFFSSAGLSETQPRAPRMNPPSPSQPEMNRYRSASSHLKTNRSGNSPSTDTSSDAGGDDMGDGSPVPKPKATPKSRFRRHQRPSDTRDWNPGTGEHFIPTRLVFPGPGPAPAHYYYPWEPCFGHWRSGTYDYMYRANRDYRKGHDSDSAASPRNPFAGTYASANFQPHFDPSQPANAKSSSHGNLRKEFHPADWHDSTQEGWFGFFTPKLSEADTRRTTPGSNGRGRTTARNGTTSSADVLSGENSSRSASTSEPKQRPTPFAAAKFSPEEWIEQFKNLSWAAPKNEGTQQANAQRARSPNEQKRSAPASKARPTPQPASVATEDEEELHATMADESNESKVPDDGEAMDLDDDAPAKQNVAPQAAADKLKPEPQNGGQTSNSKNTFNLKNLSNAAPFTSTNSGGIDDLNDISQTLPFESRPKAQRMTARDVRPRELACPNPPKRPRRPALTPTGIGAQMALPKHAWERYVAEMNIYMREWNEFNRRMLRHFNARQDANETGLAPRWISSVGDSGRLNVNGNSNDEGDVGDDERSGVDDDLENYTMEAGTARGGYNAYLRAIEEDVKVRKHWDVASELHRECILELGEIREWILNGGKII